MATFYEEMQSIATELMGEFNQGTIRYIQPGATTGPAYEPVIGSPTPYTVNATVKGVSQKYIEEGYVSASDLEATLAVFDVEPELSGTLEIGGEEKQIVEVMPIPASGTVVAWKLIVKA